MENWQKKIKPLPVRYRVLKFQLPSESTALQSDWTPESMDEKWIGLLSQNYIDLYRSWSGTHVCRIELISGQNGIRKRLFVTQIQLK